MKVLIDANKLRDIIFDAVYAGGESFIDIDSDDLDADAVNEVVDNIMLDVFDKGTKVE